MLLVFVLGCGERKREKKKKREQTLRLELDENLLKLSFVYNNSKDVHDYYYPQSNPFIPCFFLLICSDEINKI